MQRCSRCIMPETAEGIKFDEDGLCQLCKNFKKFKPKGAQKLSEDIRGFIDKNSKYHCVVPVSGGRDSSYALYYSKEVLKLNPIAVHNDNDFETEIARINLKNITKNLNVPLVRVNSSKQLSRKIVSEKFKMNAFFGPQLVVDQTCEACKYGFESASYNIAKKEGIKLIFWGDSTDESTIPYHSMTAHKTPTKWQRLLSPGFINLIKYKYYFRQLKNEYGLASQDGLKEIHFYDYIEWDRKTIVAAIQKKLGWAKPTESATSWRIDCSLVPLVNYLTKKAFGASKIEIGFSNMIRSGKMNRDEALKQIWQIDNNQNIDSLKNLLKMMHISSSCIKKVLS